ncbi:Putative ABC transporter, atp-binding protein [gamma proteobacterium HdN1]|nr:Putative ABC transporter, atp-binding protein [gamma proteobacterium HdN1]
MSIEAGNVQNSLAICAENLSKSVEMDAEILQLLDQVNLTVRVGESLAIVGSSGSGKSTLLGLLAGLDVPTSGRVVLDSQVISTMNEDQRAAVRAGRVGFVFQSFQLLPNLTALENVMLPLELLHDREAARKATEMLARVGLAARGAHYPRQLSGGEQQRVALARAFVVHPTILFADEPTGNLDSRTGERIMDLLFELNRELDTTLVLVTHDARLADRCQRELRLEFGRVVEHGNRDKTETQP